MNYFPTLVVLRKGLEPLSVKMIIDELEAMLKPFSECYIPDGATDYCRCITSSAEKISLDKMGQLVDTFLAGLLEELGLTEEWELFKNSGKNNRKVISKLRKIKNIIDKISDERFDRMQEFVCKHFSTQTPNSECRWCKGSGKIQAIINPNKKFDKWHADSDHLSALSFVYANDKEGIFTEEAAHNWLKQQLDKTDNISGDKCYGAILTPDGVWHGEYDEEECKHHVEKAGEVLNKFPGHYVVRCVMSY